MKAASFEAVAKALNDAQVPFIVVGGLAVNAHGYGRLTFDIDLVIPLALDTVRTAFAALASVGYRPMVPVTGDQFADPALRRRWIAEKGMKVLNFHADAHRETRVDIFVELPFDFDEEYRVALVEQAGPGVPVHIIGLPALIRMKEQADRPVDRGDLAELRLLHGEDAGGGTGG